MSAMPAWWTAKFVAVFALCFKRQVTRSLRPVLGGGFSYDFHRKPPWRLSRNPGMKMRGRAADFCGTKKKRGKKEERISMGKKANAFFFSGSPFLFFSFFPHDFHRKGEEYEKKMGDGVCYFTGFAGVSRLWF